MGDDEVFAARFTNEPRIRSVSGDVLACGAPHRLENLCGTGEMNSCQITMVEHHVADRRRVSGHEIDDAGRKTGGFEQFCHVVIAEDCRACGFPNYGIAHERGC